MLFAFTYCKCFISIVYFVKVIKMNMIAITIYIFSHAIGNPFALYSISIFTLFICNSIL